jgi:hypothetical protein
MICPICRFQIGRSWEPHRILDSLSISWQCPNGHQGQINKCELIIPPIGRPPLDFPLIAPVDDPRSII